MKKTFLSIIFFVVAFINSNAQDETRQSLDLLQRKVMKDSLHVDDAIVTKIFEIRDSMDVKVSFLRKDLLLTAVEKESKINVARKNTNASIRKLLGDKEYKHYKDMIVRRLKKNADGVDKTPLAGETDSN